MAEVPKALSKRALAFVLKRRILNVVWLCISWVHSDAKIWGFLLFVLSGKAFLLAVLSFSW